MKKKKLLIDLSVLKYSYCGLGQVALNYGNYFKQHYFTSQADYELYFLLPKKKFGAFGSEVKYINSSNFFYKNIPFFVSLFNPQINLWHAIHQMAKSKPFYRNTKYILTIHDYNFVYEKSPQKAQKYLKKVQSRIDRADKIVAISNFAKKEIECYSDLKGKQVEVIYNGVEQLDASKAKRPDFVKNDKPFFFTIGQVREKKNFHVLLPLMKYFPEKALYIAGDKNSQYGDFIARQIKEMDLKNVHLVGTVSNEERIWLYKNCDAFLFPSLLEGFGLPVIEAMQFGKPVFSSQETSLKEIGGNCAFFWKNFEPETMKETVEKGLSAFEKMPELSEKNREYANSFSYQKHIERYLEIYLTI
ncbi:MAG: glycosyltransferase family 4 protein [Prevotellaceae bacterium]|jgi:glycosyltransferase involved in cell wall biosynthesis|nr:glycosyltransferase family 4 protein [Prevotellaceae bacterium]